MVLYLLPLTEGWTAEQRMQIFRVLEDAQQRKPGAGLARYLIAAARKFAPQMLREEIQRVLGESERWPNVALGILYNMPPQLNAEDLAQVRQAGRTAAGPPRTVGRTAEVRPDRRAARSGDPAALGYLRQIWEDDPERRMAAALGLAQVPSEENWDYLIRSLPILEGAAAREVLGRLRSVNLAPEEPEHYRQVILRGLELRETGAKSAIELLEYWTGERHSEDGDDWTTALAGWQQWYHKQWPQSDAAELPADDPQSKWRWADVWRQLNSDQGRNGSPDKGARVFQQAQCARCHRVGSAGGTSGPDLTAIGRRFTRKQLLEAVLYPSHTIAEPYATGVVISTAGRLHFGAVKQDADSGVTVLPAEGQPVNLAGDEIESVHALKASPMPQGLLDQLSPAAIADLFAYLGATGNARLARRDSGDAGAARQ